MSSTRLSYAVVTPARNEAENLLRLARCLAAQTVLPDRWVIVDTGSTDGAPEVAGDLARSHGWIQVESAPDAAGLARGGPIVRGFHRGLAALQHKPDVVVKLDADISFEPDYFARLLSAFAADPQLGLASGSAYEERDGAWRQVHTTRTSVWGASRAYRRSCLQDVLPLEERMGWDGVDELKAINLGWRTRTLLDLPFRHHRREGERDGSRWAAWEAQGSLGHFMGYRVSYLVMRALFRARVEPAALAMLWGYAKATLRREPQCAAADVRARLRERQRARELPLRLREALGRRPA